MKKKKREIRKERKIWKWLEKTGSGFPDSWWLQLTIATSGDAGTTKYK